LNIPAKRRLGRGLAALIGDDDPPVDLIPASTGMRHVPIDAIAPNAANPRKTFAEEDLQSLADSIRSKGLLQPLIVRPTSQGVYEIVAGERRWRAAQRAQLHDVPVVIRELDDRETLEIALIENIQRADLNPLEEALGYKQLMEQYAYTQQQLADGLGKSRSHIANTMRLLNLPASVRESIEKGLLTAGHARTLVATDNPEAIAQEIIKIGMSVRQAEEHVRNTSPKTRKAGPTKDADTKAVESQLANALGLKVDITHHGDKGGTLTISYKTLDQLEDVIRKLK
jgi:ParB family transcriptional regulator, chromosome partitioning protein